MTLNFPYITKFLYGVNSHALKMTIFVNFKKFMLNRISPIQYNSIPKDFCIYLIHD